jgi:formate hydrogenlyase subunit 6/NADH:ubiquinone oxidoreductase subunit I
MKTKVAYYSGTGGAERVAQCFAERLAAQGCDACVERIAAPVLRGGDDEQGYGHRDSLVAYDLLVLVTVVHDFTTPRQVRLWIDGCGDVPGLRAAVISVSGGGEAAPNHACRSAAIKALEDKGATVFFEDMLVMPCNYFFRIKHPLDAMEMEAYPLIVEKRVAELLAGVCRRTSPPLFDRLVAWMSRNAYKRGARFGHAIAVSDGCTGCGLCARGCPSGNIAMEAASGASGAEAGAAASDKPVFVGRCAVCLRCFYICPNKALRPGREKYAVLKGGYDLDEIAARRATADDWARIDKLAPGPLYAGVRKYLREARPLIPKEPPP